MSRSPSSTMSRRNFSAPSRSSGESAASARPMRRACRSMRRSASARPGLGRIEQALAPVERPGLLPDEAGIDELLQHPPEALLGDLQDVEQVGDADARMAVDEMHHPVMRPPEAVAQQRRVRVGDEIPVGEEEQLDEGDLRLLADRDGSRHHRRGFRPCGRTSPPLKFTSAMLTYFRSFVTETGLAAKGMNRCALASFPCFFAESLESAAPYRRLRCDAKGRQLADEPEKKGRG